MKLFLLLIILLCELLKGTDAVKPKKCFNNVTGFCRKRCKLGEISDIGCLRGQYCCVIEEENRKQQNVPEVQARPLKTEEEGVVDYVFMPTITVATINF